MRAAGPEEAVSMIEGLTIYPLAFRMPGKGAMRYLALESERCRQRFLKACGELAPPGKSPR